MSCFEPKRKRFLRGLALFTVILFTSNQVTWTQDYYVPAPTGNFQPEKEPEVQKPQAPSQQVQDSQMVLTQDFLRDTLALTPPTPEEEEKTVKPDDREEKEEGQKENETDKTEILSKPYAPENYAHYSLERAFDLLRPEFASAVILERPLSREDLKELLDHAVKEGIEIAGVILYGVTALITSGSGDEIAASPAARDVLKNASFAFHIHPDELSKEGPTGPDLEAAQDQLQYLLTRTKTYAYTKDGITGTGDTDWLTQRYLEALKEAETLQNEKQAREELNLLITEQDKLNQITKEAWETWLAGGTISYTSGLTTSSVTTLPGSPYPYYLAGSSAGTTLALNSDGRFKLGYDVRTSGSVSGMTVSFDNASTSTIETQNLSTFTYVTFGLVGNASSVKVRFVDINGKTDLFTLTNMSSSTERFWRIKTSNIVSTVDKTRIKQVDLFVDQSTTSSTKRTGNVYIRSKGLNINAPTQPVVTSTVPQATNQTTLTLSGTKEANTSILINNVEVIARNSATTWSYTVNLSTEGNNTFNIQAKNSIGKLSTTKAITVLRDTVLPTGSVSINSDAAYTTSRTVTLALQASDSSSGVDQVRFSVDGGTSWTGWEAFASTRQIDLTNGDGTKEVQYQVRDKAGNVATLKDTVILDTVVPSGSIQINGGAAYTNSRTVTAALTASDATSGVDKIRFSLDGGSNWTAWEDSVGSKSLTLPDGDGTKEVRYQVRDKAGNIALFTSSITLDMTAPAGTIKINNGAAYTISRTVTLTLTGSDATSGLGDMSFSKDAGTTWTNWEAFNETKTLVLPEGDGQKEVRAKLRDKAGNESQVYSSSIILAEAPDIQFLTSQIATDTSYALRYRVNDKEFEEKWILAPGKNRLVIEVKDPYPDPYFFTFEVDYSLTPKTLLTELLKQNPPVNFTLTLRGIKTQAGEDLADLFSSEKADLVSPKFDSNGNLTDGILKFPDGRAAEFISGKLTQFLEASGALEVFSLEGELAWVIDPDGTKSVFSYRVDSFDTRNLQASSVAVGGSTGYYDNQGMLRFGGLSSGESVVYEGGVLRRIIQSNGTAYDFDISTPSTDVYESRLRGAPPSDSPEFPVLLRYDKDKVITYAETAGGRKLKFQNGLLVKSLDSGGNATDYTFENSPLGELLGFKATRAGYLREYDEKGNLVKLVTQDGVIAHTEGESVKKVDLGGGRFLTDLVFDNEGNIIDVRVHEADGMVARYVKGEIVEAQFPDGSTVTYSQGKPATLAMVDGRTYRYVYGVDASGNETTTLELVSLKGADGDILRLENTNLKEFELFASNPFDEIAGKILPPGSPTFIPYLRTEKHILRNLRFDESRKLLDAEILTTKGDQYFVKGGKLEKIIDSKGSVVSFKEGENKTPQAPVSLTSEEDAYRTALLEKHLSFFTSGAGVDPVTGLPVDYVDEQGNVRKETQPTAIGFYLQILGMILEGSIQVSGITKNEALQSAVKALDSLLQIQSEAGWNGLLPFVNLETLTPSNDVIGFGDNVNLAQSLAAFLGSLDRARSDASLNAQLLDSVSGKAESFIENQRPGYEAMFDPSQNLFRRDYNLATGEFSGFNDRLMNEFRTGLAFVIRRFGFPEAAWSNLIHVKRTYQDKEGTSFATAIPFDGSAFQMFWPILRAEEELSPELETALWNYLYAQADYSNKTKLPGFLSSSFDPLKNDYEAKIGVPELAETRDTLENRTASVYALASAFKLAPHFVLSWLKAIEAQGPELQGTYGFYDSVHVDDLGVKTIGKRVYSLDQASLILGLAGGTGESFTRYLETHGLASSFKSLYNSLKINLSPVEKSLPVSPFATDKILTDEPPHAPPLGFFLEKIFNPEKGDAQFDYFLSPQSALSDTKVRYTVDSLPRNTDLLTYFEKSGRRNETNYLLSKPPVNLFEREIRQGSIYTPGQGWALEARREDPERGFVTTFDYGIVPNGAPVGYYAQFGDMDLSDVDFLTFSVRRDEKSNFPKTLEVKLEGLGESFLIDNIPTSWKRVVLPLKKPNQGLKQLSILIHDQATVPQEGRIYFGDITLFSVKPYSANSWETGAGITQAQIETLAREYLASGQETGPKREHTLLSGLTLSSDGVAEKAQVDAKNGAQIFFDNGKISKLITPDGKTILYAEGVAGQVTSAQGESGLFSYTKNFKGEVEEVVIEEPGKKRVYTPNGVLKRLIFQGLSGGLTEGSLSSLRTRYETITELASDEFGHIKDATIHLKDGRTLYVKNAELVRMTRPSGTEVFYKDGLVREIRSSRGNSQYDYTFDVNGKISKVTVRYEKDGTPVQSDLIVFLEKENRIEEAAILLDSPLINVTEIASNIGSFFTPEKGFVVETRVTDPERGSVYKVDYTVPANPSYMGVYFRFPKIDLTQYELMNISYKGAYETGNPENPTLTVELKGPTGDRITLDNLGAAWTDTNVPVEGNLSEIYEITILINPPHENTSGTFHVGDISFYKIRKIEGRKWQEELSFTDQDLEAFSSEAAKPPLVEPTLYKVEMPLFEELLNFPGYPVSLLFNPEGKVSQFKRGDGTRVEVSGNVPLKSVLNDGHQITYTADQNERVVSAQVTDTSTGKQSQASYAYTQARQVTTEEGKQIEYQYEFDEAGSQVTVVKDLATGEVRRFKGDKIQSVDDKGGLVTTYSFENGKLKESTLTYKGKAVLDIAKYEQAGDKTFITDRSGIVWIYDSQGNLIQHRTPNGLLYQHTEYTNDQGEIEKAIFLVERVLEDGTRVLYEKGEVTKIIFGNGVIFTNPTYDTDHNLTGGKVLYEDGSEVSYVNNFAVQVKDFTGTTRTFTLPEGKIELETDEKGQVQFVRVEKDGFTLRYNRTGDLVNLTTPEGVLYQYVYEEIKGERTGKMKVYRTELAKAAGVSIPFALSAEVNGFGDIRVLVNHELVFGDKNQLRVFAIDPQTGAIDGAASFDLKLAGKGEEVLNFIKEIPDGEYVLVVYPETLHSYSTDSPKFFEAMEAIGAKTPRDYFRDWSLPWIVLGQKGIKPGQAYETFESYQFNEGTIRLDTEKVDVFYLDENRQVVPRDFFASPETVPTTSRHGEYLSEVTEVFGTITDGQDIFASSYFKNYDPRYPESGFYRFLPDFESRNFIERPVGELDQYFQSLIDLTNNFEERAVYFDDRYPTKGITLNNARALKGYFVSKGFRVLNANELKSWMEEKGPDAIVLMAQDIAPDTIVNPALQGKQLPRTYLARGGSMVWFYDVPFYEIGHANRTSEVWGSAGDHFGKRQILGISAAFEPSNQSQLESFYRPQAVPLDPEALSKPLKLDFDIRELDAWFGVRENFKAALPSPQTDIASIFNKEGVVIGVLKGDGSTNVFEEGRLRTILDRKSRHAVDYFYNTEGELIATDFIESRENVRQEIVKAELEVLRLKTKALIQLAANLNLGTTQIEEEIVRGRAELAQARSQAESQRYVTQCRACGLSDQCCETFENPAYREAIGNIETAERQLEQDAAQALADLHTEVTNARQKIAEDESSAIQRIHEKEKELIRGIIQNEITPILIQYYRLLLGRDPGKAEVDRWLDQAELDPQARVNTEALKSELLNSPERATRLAEIAWIKAQVKAFLERYVTLTPQEQATEAASLGLLSDEIVSLTGEEVQKILTFLDNQNIHFGYSAFLPLQALLRQGGKELEVKEIAVKALLIDILSGVTNPFSEGILKLSLFSLERTAQVYGLAPKGAKLTYDELVKIYGENPDLEMLIHLNGDHYVRLVKVTQDRVTYIDTAVGAQGETIELTKEEFLKLWLSPQVGKDQGVVLAPEAVQIKPEQRLDQKLLQLITGGLCGIDDAIFWTIVFVSAVVSGTVQAISARDGNFVVNFLKGFAFGAITAGVTMGIGSILSSFASAVGNLVGNIVQGIKSFVTPLLSGLKAIGSGIVNFVSTHISSTLGSFLRGAASFIGKGISAVTSFISETTKVAIQGFQKLGNFIQNATGIKAAVANTVFSTAVDLGINKGLRALGVNPTVAALASAFVRGGLLGGLTPGPDVIAQGVRSDGTLILVTVPANIGRSAIDGFIRGGITGLTIASIPVIGRSLNIAPEITGVLGNLSRALLGAGTDISDALKGLAPKLFGEFAIAGVTALGRRIGLDPRLVSVTAGVAGLFVPRLRPEGPSITVKICPETNPYCDPEDPDGDGIPDKKTDNRTALFFKYLIDLVQYLASRKTSSNPPVPPPPSPAPTPVQVEVSTQVNDIAPLTSPDIERHLEQKYSVPGGVSGVRVEYSRLTIPSNERPSSETTFGSYVTTQKGGDIAKVLDENQDKFFQRETVEKMVKASGASDNNAVEKFFDQQVANGRFEDYTENGRALRKIPIDEKSFVVYDRNTNELVKIQESLSQGNLTVDYGKLMYDIQNKRPYLLDGNIIKMNPAQTGRTVAVIQDGNLKLITIDNSSQILAELKPLSGEISITADSRALFDYELDEIDGLTDATYRVEGGLLREVRYTVGDGVKIGEDTVSFDADIIFQNDGKITVKGIAKGIEAIKDFQSVVNTALQVKLEQLAKFLKVADGLPRPDGTVINLPTLDDIFGIPIRSVRDILAYLGVPKDRALDFEKDFVDFFNKQHPEIKLETRDDIFQQIKKLKTDFPNASISQEAFKPITTEIPDENGRVIFKTASRAGIFYKGTSETEIWTGAFGEVTYTNMQGVQSDLFGVKEYNSRHFFDAEGHDLTARGVVDGYKDGKFMEFFGQDALVHLPDNVQLPQGESLYQHVKVRYEVAKSEQDPNGRYLIVRVEIGNYVQETTTFVRIPDKGSDEENRKEQDRVDDRMDDPDFIGDILDVLLGGGSASTLQQRLSSQLSIPLG